MGEEKRKRERLEKWYGRSIVAGHPDFPKPKPLPTIPIAAPQRIVSKGIEHDRTNAQEGKGTPPIASNERIISIDPQMPGSDQTVVTERRTSQSAAYRRVNRQSAFATMALLSLVGTMGTTPSFAETIGEPGDKRPYKPRR